jgi:hypothetical protein
MKNKAYIVVSVGFLAVISGCASKPPVTSTGLPGISKSDPVYQYVAAMRDDLSAGNVELITDVMHLSAAEAKVFWPIYHDYEAQLFELGDQRLELIKQFTAAQQAGKLDDTKAAELMDGYFKFEAARLALVKNYHAEISRALSPLHAAQFAQIEHRTGTVIDLLIASELPLVLGKAGKGE